MNGQEILSYVPILMMFLVSLAIATGMVVSSSLFGQKVKSREKLMPYECGKDPVGSARERFSVKFYMVALMFILFDIEAIFFVPWAVVFRKMAEVYSKAFVFLEMLVFIAVLLVGYIYVWKKGILDWK
ncbi:MAG: NADH-quinone oxidoreductase subunit A [Acidobacteriota bacterium]|nr:NADH-quinone oxidoreductase subunit A [Blastocatellia bacterium]MDW8412770.1 NADH-quinone oxidoreductase subunit A [Acidobacteriota bacterium]